MCKRPPFSHGIGIFPIWCVKGPCFLTELGFLIIEMQQSMSEVQKRVQMHLGWREVSDPDAKGRVFAP